MDKSLLRHLKPRPAAAAVTLVAGALLLTANPAPQNSKILASLAADTRSVVTYNDGTHSRPVGVVTDEKTEGLAGDEALRAIAPDVARASGLSEDDAYRKLRDERVLNEAFMRLAEDYPEDFGGSWFADRTATVRFKGSPPPTALLELRGLPLEFYRVESRENLGFTLSDAYTAKEAVEAQLRGEYAELLTKVAINWDVVEGTLEVDVEKSDAADAFMERIFDPETKTIQGVPAQVQHATINVADQVVRGGAKFKDVGSSAYCTTAFSFAMADRDVLSTAAHCRLTYPGEWKYVPPNTDPYVDTSRRGYGYGSGQGDVEVFSTPDSEAPSFYYNNSNDVMQVQSFLTQTVGTSVCWYGRTSGKACGTMANVGYSSSGYTGMTTVASAVTMGGDSGGPYFAGSAASGIHKGFITVDGVTRQWYTPTNRVSATIGENAYLKFAP